MFWILVALAAGLIVGYVGRKYVEKRWPDEAKLIDLVATNYGESAAASLSNAITAAKAKVDG